MDNPSIKWGLFLGITMCTVNLICYLISPQVLINFAAVIGIFVYIGAMFLVCIEQRKDLGGYADFRKMFTTAIIVCIIGGLISTILLFVLNNYINPNLIELNRDVAIENLEKMSGLLPEDKMEQEVQKIENMNPVGLKYSLYGYGLGLLFSTVAAAIIGAIMQKKDPTQI